MDIRRKTFVDETTSRLQFLLNEHGFAEPEITPDGDYPLLIRVSYHRSDLAVEESLILSYAGEEYVTASVVHSSSVSGPVNHTEISTSTAHTGFQMRQALSQHAQALRDYLSTQQLRPRPKLRAPSYPLHQVSK